MSRAASVLLVVLSLFSREAGDATQQTDWQTVRPGGSTGCAFDTPFEFWVREGDPGRVLLYLQGGGICWDRGSCDPAGRISFDRAIDSADYRQRRDGVFDRAHPANPFRRHTLVFVPYCTGDVHLGGRTVRYTDSAGGSVTVRHQGHRNLDAVLAWLAARPAPPADLVVTGGSAGAVASPAFAARLAARFPGAAVRQMGDGAAAGRLTGARRLLGIWGADSVLAAWDLPLAPAGDPFAGMYLAAAARHPRIRFSQIATTEDAVAAGWLRVFGEDPARLRDKIRETYAELAGLCFQGYAVPGEFHTILWRPEFYTARADGVLLSDLLAREPAGSGCIRPGTLPGPVDTLLVRAAGRFLESLSPSQRTLALFGLDDSLRTSWSYIPRGRAGLSLKQMTPVQRHLVHALLRSLLSHGGYLKVTGIIGLESYLQLVEQQGFPRDPEAYVLQVFGAPGTAPPWGFRFEGHHVSVNFTTVGQLRHSTTPLFLGANPAVVPVGPQAGFQVLAPEESVARELLASMTPVQLGQAVVGDTAPPDIFTGNASVAARLRPAGISGAGLTADQRLLLQRLIDVYLGNLHSELAEPQRRRVHALRPEQLFFAWLGGRTPGAPHYYRIQGPSVLIEYDHTSNHVHTVWRDLDGDFGRDLLQEHHRQTRHESTRPIQRRTRELYNPPGDS